MARDVPKSVGVEGKDYSRKERSISILCVVKAEQIHSEGGEDKGKEPNDIMSKDRVAKKQVNGEREETHAKKMFTIGKGGLVWIESVGIEKICWIFEEDVIVPR